MATAARNILNLVPTMQATALAGKAYGMTNKKRRKHFVKDTFSIITGTSLMPPTAQMIGMVD